VDLKVSRTEKNMGKLIRLYELVLKDREGADLKLLTELSGQSRQFIAA
jgi:hypothetical protein